jgi:hypothetical protein
MSQEFLAVDPRTLRACFNRPTGADPFKLARQLVRFGTSMVGMPPIVVWRCYDGELMIIDGMTRATRVADLLPGQHVRVEVSEEHPQYDASRLPTIGDLLP